MQMPKIWDEYEYRTPWGGVLTFTNQGMEDGLYVMHARGLHNQVILERWSEAFIIAETAKGLLKRIEEKSNG